VDTIVSLSATHQGTSRVGSITDRLPARAPGEADWGPRHPTIHYVNFATRFDKISTPYRVTLMPPGPNVTNTLVQDVCPASKIGHVGMAYSPTVAALVRNALDPTHPVPVVCGSSQLPSFFCRVISHRMPRSMERRSTFPQAQSPISAHAVCEGVLSPRPLSAGSS